MMKRTLAPLCCGAVLLATVTLSGCSPLTPSSFLAVERRDGRYLLLAFACESTRVEKISVGRGTDLEGGYQADLDTEDLVFSGGAFEFELTGLAPPGTGRSATPEFPLHLRVQFYDGESETSVSKAPSESRALFHEDNETLVEVEKTREIFLKQADALCEERTL